MSQHDPVNHPAHYLAHPSGVECITIAQHLNFCVGNAVKYLWRAGLKSPNPIEDLKKARWYLDCEIRRLESEAPKAERWGVFAGDCLMHGFDTQLNTQQEAETCIPAGIPGRRVARIVQNDAGEWVEAK